MKKEDRLLAKHPFRHYRRTYSVVEARWGALLLVGMCAVGAWVVYKGQHPEAALYGEAPAQTRRGEELGGQQAAPSGRASRATASAEGASAADRGPVPTALAPNGWRERSLSVYGPDNVYEKINGREGFFRSFGFQKGWFLTLEDERNPEEVVDVEVYDLGEPQNALGAFAGETPEEATPELLADGLQRLDRNAAFVTRGRFYVRAVAADETETLRQMLEHVLRRFRDEVKGEALPWSYALFVAGLGADPGKVNYAPENAFSFGFATGVHIASLDADLEVFVMPCVDDAAAGVFAGRFIQGWLSYGEKDGAWVKDRYLSLFAGAVAEGRFVIGLRGAADKAAADVMLGKLKERLRSLPASVRDQIAVAGKARDEDEDEDEPAEETAPAEEEPGEEEH